MKKLEMHLPPLGISLRVVICQTHLTFLSCKISTNDGVTLFEYAAKVIRDRQHGRSKRFAVVTYDTKEEAEKALNGMKYRRLDGYHLFFKPREFDVPVQEHVPIKTNCIIHLDLDDLDESEGIISFDLKMRYYNTYFLFLKMH